MRNSAKTLALLLAVSASAYGNVCNAADCKEIDTDKSIAALVMEHPGSKVLKVAEAIDAQGCIELKVRILLDGTIKAITIPNKRA